MSASLVGSEMCIRDSPTVGHLSGPRLCRLLAEAASVLAVAEAMLAHELLGGGFLLSVRGPEGLWCPP
eukprot:12775089-Alexandrium_andersonii.AAC.1